MLKLKFLFFANLFFLGYNSFTLFRKEAKGGSRKRKQASAILLRRKWSKQTKRWPVENRGELREERILEVIVRKKEFLLLR